MKYVIYGLVDPRDNLVRYVGLSSSGFERPKRHFSPSVIKRWSHLPVYRWIKSLQHMNMRPNIRILEILESRADLPSAEIRWIALYNVTGHRLLNLTSGGESFSSKEPWNKGKTWDETTRLKMSKAKIGKKQSQDHILKRTRPTPNRKKSKEIREHHRLANTQRIAFIDQFGQHYASITEACRKLGMAHADISDVLKGKKESHRGYSFRRL